MSLSHTHTSWCLAHELAFLIVLLAEHTVHTWSRSMCVVSETGSCSIVMWINSVHKGPQADSLQT